MSTYREQFESALKCTTPEEAAIWMDAEIRRYVSELVSTPEEARRVILINLGYMAGYYDSDTAKKVGELFGANHPILGRTY